MGEQSLADAGVTIGEIADSTDGVTRFAILDMALLDPFHPDRVAVEVADNAPNPIGGLIDHCAVIEFVHNSSVLQFRSTRLFERLDCL
jgi:hypothetical protein